MELSSFENDFGMTDATQEFIDNRKVILAVSMVRIRAKVLVGQPSSYACRRWLTGSTLSSTHL
jgi:hypothetical protein